MILKGLKEKSIKKNLTTILNNRETHFNNNKIESLGVILNAEETTDFEAIETFAKTLNLSPNKLKIIAFTELTKEITCTWENCFNPKDFTWNGKINNLELKSFLDTKFDLLISYYANDVSELKYLTSASNAHFKVGIFQKDSRLNDLIIKTDFNNLEAFKVELKKYLTVLNKLKA
ncbi:DUF6913 domain-containing protein [Bizionia arctica]|uniref:Uncharacterized protein n=1 Tax=Bizionia arctica TaxID=1495645 RepID=A0A917GF53_9FLAO|nr:hypothetical protein [Bizionia arctica]GGG42955.1 hypothetical protein GCM10010976_13020 [Bizionia arctica]